MKFYNNLFHSQAQKNTSEFSDSYSSLLRILEINGNSMEMYASEIIHKNNQAIDQDGYKNYTLLSSNTDNGYISNLVKNMNSICIYNIPSILEQIITSDFDLVMYDEWDGVEKILTLGEGNGIYFDIYNEEKPWMFSQDYPIAEEFSTIKLTEAEAINLFYNYYESYRLSVEFFFTDKNKKLIQKTTWWPEFIEQLTILRETYYTPMVERGEIIEMEQPNIT